MNGNGIVNEERLPAGRMLDLIRSKSYEGRRAIIAELQREKSARSVGLLIEILNDESWSLRELAMGALADCEELAAPQLLVLLDRGLWYTRAAAARTLGLMAHGPAIPKLLRMVDDANRTIADEAARALLRIASGGRAVAVARGVLSRGRQAADVIAVFDRIDPDASRKVRILSARDDVRSPVQRWLADEHLDRELFFRELQETKDADFGIRWDEISGPVGV